MLLSREPDARPRRRSWTVHETAHVRVAHTESHTEAAEPHTPRPHTPSRTPSTSSTPSTGPHTFNRFAKKTTFFTLFCSKTRSKTRFYEKCKEVTPFIFARSIQKRYYLFKIRSNKLQIWINWLIQPSSDTNCKSPKLLVYQSDPIDGAESQSIGWCQINIEEKEKKKIKNLMMYSIWMMLLTIDSLSHTLLLSNFLSLQDALF